MPVGYSPTQQSVNQSLGQLSVLLRNLCRQITDLHSALVSMGASPELRASALQSLGFSHDDAVEALYLNDVLNTVAALYYGNAVQPDPFDFDNALSALWGTVL